MKCIYCQEKMSFNEEYEKFICPECRGQLRIYQGPTMTTLEDMQKREIELMKPIEGVSVRWFRGNK